MKLGILTVPFSNNSLMEVADWASSENFEALEIACWPSSATTQRRYAGTSHIDVANISKNEAQELAIALCEKGLTVSGLGFYPNPLDPNEDDRKEAFSHLRKVVDCASWMGVPVVNTFCGGDANLTLDENWRRAQKIWPEFIAYTKDAGVRLAFENCPMIFSDNEWPGGHNIAYSPYIWRRIVDEWHGSVSINFDPSHLVWQMIDQRKFIQEFGEHIHHVHAKDVKIDQQILYERGVMSLGMGWQIPRMPGLGDMDWDIFFSELYRCGYDGSVIVEHEDEDFEGTDELVKRGFLLARQKLAPYIV